MRANKLQYINMCQFNLAYLANIDFESTNEMSVAEFNNVHRILVEQKQHEKEEHDKAIAASKAKKK